MLTEYLTATMQHARYEILSDDGTYYGEIPECPGVYANAPTLEDCRNELTTVLEDWLLFRVHKNLSIPII
jgi:predicted RNase H-like HicB family nuclease